MKSFNKAAATAFVLGISVFSVAPAQAAIDLQLTEQDERQIALAQEYNRCTERYAQNPPQSVIDEIKTEAEKATVELRQKKVPEDAIRIYLGIATSMRFAKWLNEVCAAETKVDWGYLQSRSEEIKKAHGDEGVQEFYERTNPSPQP